MNSSSHSFELWKLIFEELTTKLNEVANILGIAIEGVSEDPEYVPQWYMRQQAGVVCASAEDVSLLLHNSKLKSVIGLCRIGFEARFYLSAASIVKDFAAQKMLDQLKKNVESLTNICSKPDRPAGLVEELKEHQELLTRYRSDLSGVRERGWKFKEVAEAAGLIKDYDRYYPLLSSVAHCTPAGLTMGGHFGIVAECTCRLIRDSIESAACLVFYKETPVSPSVPITKNYALIVDRLAPMLNEQDSLSKRIEDLLIKYIVK